MLAGSIRTLGGASGFCGLGATGAAGGANASNPFASALFECRLDHVGRQGIFGNFLHSAVIRADDFLDAPDMPVVGMSKRPDMMRHSRRARIENTFHAGQATTFDQVGQGFRDDSVHTLRETSDSGRIRAVCDARRGFGCGGLFFHLLGSQFIRDIEQVGRQLAKTVLADWDFDVGRVIASDPGQQAT